MSVGTNQQKILGISLGDPYSAGTYSGVPYHLFAELEKRGELAGRLNGNCIQKVDVFSNLLDWKESFKKRKPRKNRYWRFLPENIERLSERLRKAEHSMPYHSSILQIGVGGLPKPEKVFMAHAEISIETAANLDGYATTYGFESGKDRYLERAMEGEKLFLEQCDVIWTNSEWTAETFAWANIPKEKFLVQPPACNCDDPGPVDRIWGNPHLLFVGKDWERKGGTLLLDAFRALKESFPSAKLTIIGCNPEVTEQGVEVLGYLDRGEEASKRKIDDAFRKATIFCMPSKWESTGLVYMEAALFGLPVVMLKGQGREGIFPAEMAIHLEDEDLEIFVDVLLEICRNPDLLQAMGSFGADYVRKNYTNKVVAERISNRLAVCS